MLHTENDTPIRNLWAVAMSTLCPPRVPEPAAMPGSIDEIEAWAYIANINENIPFQGKQLFYYAPAIEREPVTIMLYGMIRSINVTPLGTWKG